MTERSKDHAHLVRLGLILVLGLALFATGAAVLLPNDFGLYGHFRAGALDLNRAPEPIHAGRAACADCHADVLGAIKGSRHARIGCETCHGPAAAHAADPSSTKPPRPRDSATCLRCHERNVARPPSFPQIEASEHAGGAECLDCHRHHHPEPEG